MHSSYWVLLGLDFIACRKLTVSSLASFAAQCELGRAMRVGAFSINHRRVYNIVRQGNRGGITFVSRTGLGQDLKDLERLVVDQVTEAALRLNEAGVAEEVLARRAEEAVTSGDPQALRDYVHGCNAHLFDNDGEDSKPQPARYCHYLDIIGKACYFFKVSTCTQLN